MGILLFISNFTYAQNALEETSYINIPPFQKLILLGKNNADIVLYQSAKTQIKVNGTAIENIHANSADSVLFVTIDAEEFGDSVRLDIFSPSYQYIYCSRVKSIFCQDTIKENAMCITTFDTNLDFRLQTNHLDFRYEGEHARLNGLVKEASIQFNGFVGPERSLLDLAELKIKDLHIDCGVLSLINLHVTGSLWLNNGTDVKLTILGNPIIRCNNLSFYHMTMTDMINNMGDKNKN